ncbi:hypothetical protein [Reichenbachiella versicolor]|uniref:hypothetical protein n=1 Tax=Reichenbachiella versicolor TaxID=1821036 RepID=UPI000D6E9F78|nr:hypothetical protein [Reichenbachiella versicolor]
MSDQQDILKTVKDAQIGSTANEVVSSLELVSELYLNVKDPNVKVLIKKMVTDLVDFLLDNDLAEGVELTKFMIYD